MPLVQTRGAASAQGFGEFAQASAVPNYIEDVFSTYLYTGNGSTQTITNGIDLSTKGGLVWIKDRSAATSHGLFDTARGVNNYLSSNSANEQNVFGVVANALTAFNSNGFSVGTSLGWLNASGDNIASWTFREQPKFFDVVTWTGDGTTGREIPHNLGSVPGCIITKCTSVAGENWNTYHRSLGNQTTVILNGTGAGTNFGSSLFNSTDPTSTVITLGTSSAINGSGRTFVAYLFAHDAGGFGLTGTDNVISCGSFTTDGSANATVSLGYEPQWVLIKRSDSTGNWLLMDNMRGMPVTANSSTTTGGRLYPNRSDADDGFPSVIANATGFITVPGTVGASATYIYIAIRRGPMKVPTSGTSVFSPNAVNNAANTQNTTNFPIDLQLSKWRGGVLRTYWLDRLRGLSSRPSSQSIITGPYMESSSLAAEVTGDDLGYLYDNTSWQTGSNLASVSMAYWNFRRAPSFFDEVCYTGNGNQFQGVPHNLGVKPEWVIFKSRNTATDGNWQVIRNDADDFYELYFLNTTNARINRTISAGNGYFTPTQIFGQQGDQGSGLSNARTNASGTTYVAYLFATCAGVSKVGSYTGNGSTQTINCGFTGGARFVLIKRTDSTGGWYVYDTARGMTVLTDPYLLLNSTAAETATLGSVTTVSTGFALDATILTAINASGGTYIFLAIA